MKRFWAIFLILASSWLAAEPPSALYLSWKGDPTTTMVIQWHTSLRSKESLLSYSVEGKTGWERAEGQGERLGASEVLVHTVELQGLLPDTTYSFRLESSKNSYKFRTCPKALSRPLRFAVAGDAYFYLYPLRKVSKKMVQEDPDFIVVGGDIAYTQGHKSLFKGKDWETRRWGTFFKEWQKLMVTRDGRLIPMVVIVGNHDVRASSSYNMFYTLFALPEKSPYRAFDFGDYLSLICLDTGHLSSIEGAQAAWLKEALTARQGVAYKFALYHVGAYPSVYTFEGRVPALIRDTWVPLFEKYGVKYAFEHHNHAYKRTHPIKAGKIDPEGVVYLGDGAWGVSPRKPKERWYLAKTSQTNCFWLVTLDREGYHLKSIDREGKTIEEIPGILKR